MAHINKAYSGLNRPQNISFDKIDPQKMFVDNIEILENLYINNIKTIILPTSSIATLRAINTSDIDIFTDGKLINVIGIGIFYFVRANTDVDDNINIIAPTIGGGRWINTNIIENTLTSTSTVNGLSANQGKILNDTKADKNSPTFTGTVNGITKAMVGLSNVDNTSDVNKPVATTSTNGLMASADKAKLDSIATGATNNIIENVLTSTSIVNGLSANQGKLLNSRIFAIESGAQKTNAFAIQSVNVSNVMPTIGQVQIYDGSQYKPTSLVINISDLVSTTKTISTFDNIYAYELGTLTSLIITAFASGFKDGYISFKTGTSISVSLPTGCKISGTDCSNNVFTPKTSKFYEMSFKKNNGVVFIIINGVV